MTDLLPKLLATSVVRGSEKGQSHGGVYLIDFESQQVEQKIGSATVIVLTVFGVASRSPVFSELQSRGWRPSPGIIACSTRRSRS